MKTVSNKTFPASLDQLYEMLSFISNHAAGIGFDQANIAKIELASEEAIVNIVSYGYPNRKGQIQISCMPHDTKGIKVVIKDYGIPYNPLANAKKYNPNMVKEEHTIGGYGVYFILKIMDEVNYIRDKEANVLTLVKYL